MTGPFTGLCAFPLTPTDPAGVVDCAALASCVDGLAASGVDSVCVLGSTGTYAYLERRERNRAAAAATEAAAGRIPVLVGVGALRTDWSTELAVAAERAGADGLLLAPMSYAPLTQREVGLHFRSVAAETWLPLCVYDNPSTTGFSFGDELLSALSGVPGIDGVKLPPRSDDGYADELARLRAMLPEGFAIGWSGDWGAPAFLSAGADAWFSVVGALLPGQSVRLFRAARAGDADDAARVSAAFQPLWSIFRVHGSLRTAYAMAELAGLRPGRPPLPILRLDGTVMPDLEAALEAVHALGRGDR